MKMLRVSLWQALWGTEAASLLKQRTKCPYSAVPMGLPALEQVARQAPGVAPELSDAAESLGLPAPEQVL